MDWKKFFFKDIGKFRDVLVKTQPRFHQETETYQQELFFKLKLTTLYHFQKECIKRNVFKSRPTH